MSSQKLMSSEGEEIRRFTDFHGDGGETAVLGTGLGKQAGSDLGEQAAHAKGFAPDQAVVRTLGYLRVGLCEGGGPTVGRASCSHQRTGTSADEAREEAGALDASGQASQANGPGPRRCGWGNPGAREELMAPTILVTW
ncbi:unnamed protein product [Ilex paraguariensis]|uniref:Uncharacterized protein n=1 Tax=Ilex paraguariensis TaxID=185542 RepID=A0ABC8SI45_9AQUA